MTPRLASIWLCEVWADAEHLDEFVEPLRSEVDIGEMSVDASARAPLVEVRAELGFSVSRAGEEGSVCTVSGTFRLIYAMPPPENAEEAALFASTVVLTDAWPVWRAWLHGQLAAMGLPPTTLPPRVPKALRAETRDATEWVPGT